MFTDTIVEAIDDSMESTIFTDTSLPPNVKLTEDGLPKITEDGFYKITED